jgi:F-type H+-transporting ATPase subunit b
MRILATLALALAAQPALAATGDYGFFSLRNTDFVVLLAFLVLLGILYYFRVPAMISGLLDRRAEQIRTELAEARALREEAQQLLSSFDRKRQEMSAQADRIVTEARAEAERAAVQARADAARAVERRIRSAEDQIAAAQAKAIREVKDQAVTVAIAAARDVLAQQITPAQGSRLIDDSIAQVGAKLH